MKSILLAFAFSTFLLGTLVRNSDLFRESPYNSFLKTFVSEEVLSETVDNQGTETDNGNPESSVGSSYEITPTPSLKPFPVLVTIAPQNVGK